MSDLITENTTEDHIDRRGFLQCMAWAGTGVLFSVSGGILGSRMLGGTAERRGDRARRPFNFVQISDSHIGFHKPANPDVAATFRETIARINALPQAPDFILHTGDLTQLSEAKEFDDLQQMLKDCRTKQVFYVPGEHDILSDNGAQYLERFGKGTHGTGWFSFDQKGVHFIGLVNVATVKEGGLGVLGAGAARLAAKGSRRPLRRARRSWSSRTSRSGRSIRNGAGARTTAARALEMLQPLRLRHGAQRPHPPGDAKGRREHHLPHRALDGLSAARARHRAEARPDGRARGEAAQFSRHHLGFLHGDVALAGGHRLHARSAR